MKKTYFFITIFIFFIIFAIIISPQNYIAAFSQGLNTWAKILLPTIFPLIFFTKLLTDLGSLNAVSNKMGFTQKLWRAPPISAYAFMVSILSGYPVGAKVVSDLYSDGFISKHDAIKMCTFTSNSGPMFIYGSVGVGMLFSQTVGLIMLISHILSAVLNGIFYRNYKPFNQSETSFSLNIKPQFSLSSSMTDSILSILLIGGFVSIFFVVIELINQIGLFIPLSSFLSGIFNCDSQIFMGLFNGIIEMTHGCLDITSLNLPLGITAVVCTGLITFGGIATMLQAFAFLQKIGISFRFFLTQKITQTIFACMICALLVLVLQI
jgi:sporulation integral membrane protein YlbJ